MKINKFKKHKFLMEEIKDVFPKSIDIYTSNGNFKLELGDLTRESGIIRAAYYHNTFEETGDALDDGEPDLLVFDLHFVTNKNGLKVIIDITYGDTTKYAFSIESPNKVTISEYYGIDSHLDSQTQFGFEDVTIQDLVELFNNFSPTFKFKKEDFTFLDKYPDTFDSTKLEEVPDTKNKYFMYQKGLELPTNSETPGQAALSQGKKILVINNSEAPKHRYLKNILNYLQIRGLNNVVVSNIKELEDVLKKYKISCVISTGSDKRVTKDEGTDMTYRVLDELNCPFLGICFGFQTLSKHFGSNIDSGKFTHKNKEIEITNPDHFLFKGIDNSKQFSFSFNDYPANCPDGFNILCKVDGKIAGISDDSNQNYGLLFHPEDIEHSHIVLDNFIGLTDKQKSEQDKLKVGKFESVLTFENFKRHYGR